MIEPFMPVHVATSVSSPLQYSSTSHVRVRRMVMPISQSLNALHSDHVPTKTQKNKQQIHEIGKICTGWLIGLTKILTFLLFVVELES